MAPKLLRKQVVTDYKKETLFNKKTTYGPESLAGLAKLLQRGQLDITTLDQLTSREVRTVSKELKLKTSKKSNTRLLEEIKAVAKIFVAGQGK